MTFKVTVAKEGQADSVRIVRNRVEAKDELMAVMHTLVAEGYTPEPSTTHNDVFQVVLRKQDAPTCTVSAFDATSIDDPLTGKFKQLKLLMSKLNPEVVAIDVEVLISTLMDKGLDQNEPALPGVTLGELINTPGFYTDNRVNEHLVASFIGRLCHHAATACQINVTDPDELIKIVPIIDKLSIVERQVVPIVKQRMIKKYGIPSNFDQELVDTLVDKIHRALTGTR